MDRTLFCNAQREGANTTEEIGNALGFAKMRLNERNHRFFGLNRCLQEATRRHRNRHFAKMNDRLFRLDDDFAFMRETREILFHHKCGERTALLVAQRTAATCRQIKARCGYGCRQFERLGTGSNQRAYLAQIIELRNDFRHCNRAFDYIDDLVALVSVKAKQHALFRLARSKGCTAARLWLASDQFVHFHIKAPAL